MAIVARICAAYGQVEADCRQAWVFGRVCFGKPKTGRHLVDLNGSECHDKRQQSWFFPMFIDGNFIKSFVSRSGKEDVP